MRFGNRFALSVLLAVAVPLIAASRAGGAEPDPLAIEIASLVESLDAVASRGAHARPGPTRLDGIAWESADGIPVGTSALGAYLDGQVAATYARTHEIAPLESGIGQRGLFSKLLGGAFRPVTDGIRLTLRLIDEVSGQTLSEATKILGFDLFSDSLLEGMEPPDLSNVESLGKIVEEALGRNRSAFRLRVSTDRGKYAAYRGGEALSVFVESDVDCHVRLYHVSWKDRRLTLIFPNEYARDNFVEGGVIRRFPEDPSEFVFEVAPPYGVDAIVAVASEQPFPDDEALSSRWEGEDGDAWEEDEESEESVTAYESGYVVTSGINAKSVERVLERGLVVRPGPSRVSGALDSMEGLSRASCYFATVKKLF